MLPSVSGGIGHISRTSALARALRRMHPDITIRYVLDTERLRPFNIEATRRMGFEPVLMQARTPANRAQIIRDCFGTADVIVDDCCRYLIPIRKLLPDCAWVSIPTHPVADELFMDWPYFEMMDAVIWAYPAPIGIPADLDFVRHQIVQTGPLLDIEDVPAKAAARARLGWDEKPVILYAPRGFPFGKRFGHRVLSTLFRAAQALQQRSCPVRLMLLAVSDPAQLQGIEHVPDLLPDWVTCRGVVSPAESLLYTRAADVVIGEGTSTMHEGAALETPLILVPGPISEAETLAEAFRQRNAAHCFKVRQLRPEPVAEALEACFTVSAAREAMLARAYELVTGGGGVEAAARAVLDV
ncbi:MAG TPA: glycosyltransferase, partial [Rhodopila sp.]|nr:glycosyltransferase [Rhodopila sp.]